MWTLTTRSASWIRKSSTVVPSGVTACARIPAGAGSRCSARISGRSRWSALTNADLLADRHDRRETGALAPGPADIPLQRIDQVLLRVPATQQGPERQVGILARVPLASGLLSGKMSPASKFAKDDHRNFNRHGEQFDVGETFSGVDYNSGLEAVEEIRKLLPAGVSMAQFALRWILMFDAVTCAIPGGKTPAQARDNCAASDLPRLSEDAVRGVARIYDERIRRGVHDRW